MDDELKERDAMDWFMNDDVMRQWKEVSQEEEKNSGEMEAENEEWEERDVNLNWRWRRHRRKEVRQVRGRRG